VFAAEFPLDQAGDQMPRCAQVRCTHIGSVRG
jgi:hypothetical protein